MDFSSDVLIDFGLNLAGYLVAVVITYLLLGNSKERKKPAAQTATASFPREGKLPEMQTPASVASDPEYIPLAAKKERLSKVSRESEPSVYPLTPAARKENRRAIYQEARRLLASGKPRSDLLRQLPLTENELEMLSVTGQA